MPRRFQFSLRALIGAMAVAAIACGALRHWRENRLDVLADRYNDLCHARDYGEAEKVAAKARALYPDELVTKQMVNACKMMRRAAVCPVEEQGYYCLPQREGSR